MVKKRYYPYYYICETAYGFRFADFERSKKTSCFRIPYDHRRDKLKTKLKKLFKFAQGKSGLGHTLCMVSFSDCEKKIVHNIITDF